ncbi:hypothetical protein OV090_15785 [Nannocystis sp. RBIL2]|uniref:hypothetical protein n=1 Tax=Nannocystis sp. RBIL2 TaxID=2996788 RepID=UPI002271592E|nr:hypothetical protein [Nannocystis sp. RBIL2]MCY1066241.1 hypothetical protein [Nannocystis sp. RBIL2]
MTFVPAPPRRLAPAPALAPARRASRLGSSAIAVVVALTAEVATAAPAAPAPGPSDSPPTPAPTAGSPAPTAAPAAGSSTAAATAGSPIAKSASPAPGDPAAPAPAPSDSSARAEGPEADPEDSSRSERKLDGPGDAATVETPAEAPPPARPASEKPPRVDGTYVGGTLGPGISFARVNDFPTPNPFVGGGATLRVGEVIYPWLSIGVEISGNLAYRSADPRQRLLQGAFLVDFGFYPGAKKQIPLSLRAGFGAGGGAVREARRTDRSGFGGAVFTAAVRYEFFPGAAKRRPTRGGGFSLGPELGWIGFMPAAKGRPMSHTVYLGLYVGFYFGS